MIFTNSKYSYELDIIKKEYIMQELKVYNKKTKELLFSCNTSDFNCDKTKIRNSIANKLGLHHCSILAMFRGESQTLDYSFTSPTKELKQIPFKQLGFDM